MPNSLVRRFALLTLCFLAVACGGGAPQDSGNELRIMSWPGYTDEDWIAAFEKETGARVKIVNPSNDAEIWAKMNASDGKDFDLITVNTAQLQRYTKVGLVVPIDLANVPNIQNMLPRFRDFSAIKGLMLEDKVYGIPVAYDTMSLIYNKDEITSPPTSATAMWDPKYKGRVIISDNSEYNVTLTALTLGYKDPFNLNDAQFEAVKERLIELNRNSLAYYAAPDEVTQLYTSNDVALVWGGFSSLQVKALRNAGANVGAVAPSEGALAWLDVYAITRGARNKALAEKWINFTAQEYIGKAMTERYGTGNVFTGMAASAQDGARLVFVQPVESPQRRADLWNEVKATQ